VRLVAGGDVNGSAPVKGETMDKKRLPPKEMTVKNVHQFIIGYSEDQIHGLQQMLLHFGVNPKMERILWALLKKEYLKRKAGAEEIEADYRSRQEKDPDAPLVEGTEKNRDCREHRRKKREEKARKENPGNRYSKSFEEKPLPFIVGLCPKCGSIMKGTPMSSCEKARSGRHFYHECQTCTYYKEVFKRRNKFREVEGG
jgi:hypothetical protein